MALQQMAWFGSTPIGALLMGWIIEISSPRVPFAVGGLSALACATAVLLGRPARQPVEDAPRLVLGSRLLSRSWRRRRHGDRRPTEFRWGRGHAWHRLGRDPPFPRPRISTSWGHPRRAGLMRTSPRCLGAGHPRPSPPTKPLVREPISPNGSPCWVSAPGKSPGRCPFRASWSWGCCVSGHRKRMSHVIGNAGAGVQSPADHHRCRHRGTVSSLGRS